MSLFNKNKGIYLERRKATRDMAVIPMTLPERVFIPVTQGNCPASTPCVKPGDRVTVGQLIARADENSAIPVHSSVSGTVCSITPRMSQYGFSDLHIEIETDGRQAPAEDLAPPVVTDISSFLEAVKNSGLVGLGGKGLPCCLVLDPAYSGSADVLIINAAESEPYLTSDYRNMLAFSKDAVLGAQDIMRYLEIKRCIIAVGADKPDAAALCRKETGGLEGFEVRMLSAAYPAGEERYLAAALTGKVLKPGVTPREAGVLVLNISTVIKLRQYLATGMPLVSRTLTVDGSAVKEPMNVEVPIGALFSDVLSFCSADEENAGKLIVSGPMTGKTLPNADFSVIKTNNAALLFSKLHASRDKETACINCGLCVRSCPAGLMPVVLMKAWQKKSLRALEKHRIEACTSCGCCSYVCPARRQLSFELSLAREWTEEQMQKTITEGRDE